MPSEKFYRDTQFTCSTALLVQKYKYWHAVWILPSEKFYRDSKIGTIYEGTSNIQVL